MVSSLLAADLLRGAAAELRQLRVVRGRHLRTERRRRRALLAIGLALHLVPADAPAAALTFFPGFPPNHDGPRALGDIDGDGDVDVLLSAGSEVVLFENTGTPSRFEIAGPVQNPFGLVSGGVASIDLADIDGDGDSDVLTGGVGEVTLYENTGAATAPAFAAAVVGPFGLPNVGSWAAPFFADIDGDGDLDALIGESGGETSFAENTGTATAPAFAGATQGAFGLATIASRVAPRFADIDADGDLDAFFGHDSTDESFFQENTGSALAPAFGPPSAKPFGFPAVDFRPRVNLADLDGDGDLDVVFSGDVFSGDEVGPETSEGVLLGNTGTAATPAFESPTPAERLPGFPRFSYESVPRFADIDGDGDLDVFIGEYQGHIWQLHNAGSPDRPRFGAGNPFGIGAHFGRAPSRAGVVDIDGDGDLDVFLTGAYDDRVRFHENTGAGASPAFAPATFQPFGIVGNFAYDDPVFVDIDDDGDPDLFFSASQFFRNVGSASAPAFVSEPVAYGSLHPQQFVDIDGDGDVDKFSFAPVEMEENTGAPGAPAFGVASGDPFGLTLADAAFGNLGDLDGDGDLDALLGDESGTTWFAENTGDATVAAFSAAVALPFGLTELKEYALPTLIDLDGDGDLDAVITTAYGFVTFFENTGTPSQPAFSPGAHAVHLIPNHEDIPYYSYYPGTSFADIDGDGDIDALVGGSYGDTHLFENTGTASSPAFVFVSANPFGLQQLPSQDWVRPDFGDLDGDGDLDVVFGDSYGNLYSQENTGATNAPAFAPLTAQPFGLVWTDQLAAPDLVDLDEDGDLDLVNGDYYGNAVFFENTGDTTTPAFAAPVVNPHGIPRFYKKSSPTFVDIDGDGDLDYFTGAYFGQTYFARNGISEGARPVPFLEYKVKEADRTGPNGILPSTCVVTVDDPLFDFGSGPSAENYRVSLVRSLSLPADREATGAVDLDGNRLLGLLIRGSSKGALPPTSGQFTPSRKHVKRTDVVVRILDEWLFDGAGNHTVQVDTKKETRLLLPTGAGFGGPPDPATGARNAFKCYKVKAAGGGANTGTLQDVKGKELKNLQVVVEDAFGDGQGHPIFGDGRRFDLRNVTELCNPVRLDDVDKTESDSSGATRTSTCSVAGQDIAPPATSLLCWRLRASRLILEQPWTFAVPPLPIDPKQQKHRKRLESAGEAIHLTHPLEAPDLVNTAKENHVCFPAVVSDRGTPK